MNKFRFLKDDEKIFVKDADIEAAAAEGISLSQYLNKANAQFAGNKTRKCCCLCS